MQQRNSNFELLRLMAMFMVVLSHMLSLWWWSYDISDPLNASNIILILCCLCINLFIFISGFFGVRLSLGKLFALAVLMGSAALMCIGLEHLLGYGASDSALPYCRTTWQEVVFPLSHTHLWFIHSYAGLLLVSPLLNWVCNRTMPSVSAAWSSEGILQRLWLNRRGVAITLELIAFENVLYFLPYTEVNHSVLHLAAMYMVGRLLAAVKPVFKARSLALCWLLFTACNLGYYFLGSENSFWFCDIHVNPLIIASAVCCFLLFAKLNFSSKQINFLASSAVAAYVFTEMNYTRELLHQVYTGVFNLPFLTPLATTVVGGTVLMVAIFFACILLDKLRSWCLAWAVDPACRFLDKFKFEKYLGQRILPFK